MRRAPGWAVLELMGHRRLAGYVSECEIAGAKMLRIDVHGETDGGDEPKITQFYPGAAIYGLTPASERVCRRMGETAGEAARPISQFDLRLPEPTSERKIEWTGAEPEEGGPEF